MNQLCKFQILSVRGGGNDAAIAELQLFDGSGKLISPSSFTVSGVSMYGRTNSCLECVQNAVDGNLNTQWYSQPGGNDDDGLAR